MSNSQTKEIAFEKSIEQVLLANGYVSLLSTAFDREKAIFPEIFVAFIKATQLTEWNKLHSILGDNTANQIIYDLTKWIELHGVLSTL
ncbi:MAG: hypothetical protein JWQ09_2731, partial [Segetibacter sp.]|nr:hypothetical protein [Segetibacter sp.]